MISHHAPNLRPYETNALHVEVRDLDQLLEAKDARLSTIDLGRRDIAQASHKLNDGIL